MQSSTIESCEILIGCFIINALLGGTARLSSIYFVESITRYNVNRKQASFPYVLAYLVRNLSGPVVGYLEQIFGIRSVTVTGCLLGTISVGACFFAEDILTVAILWGAIFGLSFGLAAQLIPSLLNQHFTLYKSRANGFAYAGNCIGAVLLPPIIESCIHSYGISGSFLVLSAIVANCIPASLLLKNPKASVKSKADISQTHDLTSNDRIENKTVWHIKETSHAIIDSAMKPADGKLTPTISHELFSITQDKKVDSNLRHYSVNHLIPSGTNQHSYPNSSVCSEIYQDTNNKDKNEFIKGISLRKMNFSLKTLKIFWEPTYIVLLIIHAGSTFVIVTIWTIILDFARDKGVGEKLAIYFVICLPLSDLVGRFGSGFVIDKNIITNPIMALICFICTALTSITFTLVNNYILILLEVLISIFQGFIHLLQVALIHEFIEEDKRNMAMACRLFLYAPLSLAISPMIGYFRGFLGSYDNVWYLLCGISLFCGCAVYFIPHLARRRTGQQ